MAGRTGPSCDAADERAASTKVEVGQIWADCDKRSHLRRLLVKEIKLGGHNPLVVCEVVRNANGKAPKAKSRFVAIRMDRLRPGSTGYKLVAANNQTWELLGTP